MNKLVIIINGKGGCGKDALCDVAAGRFKVKNISYITPIKEIARIYGGYNGDKSLESRNFLSNLDDLFEDYGNPQFKYIKEEYEKFKNSDSQILFVNARKVKAISRLMEFGRHDGYCRWTTLLITNPRTNDKVYGNTCDDHVNEYNHDYEFANDKNIDEIGVAFNNFIEQILNNNQ